MRRQHVKMSTEKALDEMNSYLYRCVGMFKIMDYGFSDNTENFVCTTVGSVTAK